ncbi:tryptophan--tRNA ligase [Wolbachia endosymbiont of Howardula sp.]|uniref:tryptophan--tRNA ligase n=1 Tax=Wolbachia endosymbiont of Howardula sp. TaxID=2916816 RepID=UPI00217DA260|nr:tryptophan--tRNA ligase [Wolbachia endosymbiont of Howardula sp.]UWI83412.1 tryptophan--tRNA ligase [Wolbachia endosymbiont of Howardula sp.]
MCTHNTSVMFSGIQPSGMIHLGNYLGAIRQWVTLQKKYQSIFCIVDLHAITSQRLSSIQLESNILKTAATYIACGINPKHSVIFLQSSVSAHVELAWLLGCHVPLGWLNRMTQFKDKVIRDQYKSSLGLYSYPVLMAADILLYRTKYVPVGQDQIQHLELTRKIALSFNQYYKTDYFILPEALISESTARIMSLRNGTSKMSKSCTSDYSSIHLDDSNELIVKKIQKAKTDSIIGCNIDTLVERPEINNLIKIYSSVSDHSIEQVCREINQHNMRRFKRELSDLIISTLSPIRIRIHDLLQDKNYLLKILKIGQKKAEKIAQQNMKFIRETIGFI